MAVGDETVRLAWYCGNTVMHFDALGNVTHETWHHNPRLSMPAEEQWLHNRRSDAINEAETRHPHTHAEPLTSEPQITR